MIEGRKAKYLEKTPNGEFQKMAGKAGMLYLTLAVVDQKTHWVMFYRVDKKTLWVMIYRVDKKP